MIYIKNRKEKNMKINGKDWKYELKFDDLFKFSAILGSLDIKPKIPKDVNEVEVLIYVIKDALLNMKTIKKELILFLASIYSVADSEIAELDPIDILDLLFEFFGDEKIRSFLSRRLGLLKLVEKKKDSLN
jgi:hypothetical protein